MKQHKWHKEIKAWADGAVIEAKEGEGNWWTTETPSWNISPSVQYRIKPTPKEPQYLYVWAPYDEENEVVIDMREPEGILDDGVYRLAGKIRLEVHDETR